MHELSIAFYMVEQASTAARSQGARRVTRVQARVGVLSGVVKESLLFSWSVATDSTLCQGAQLDIDDVPVTVRCPRCPPNANVHTLSVPPRFRCPVCAEPTPELITGRELEIHSLEWQP
ncbi:MAG: hydrogenase maturation nickel metallochaperone HypA [Planctomycetota bacterium]|nr:hydrogenase maturation nickel metallochaperone HypA [Planctomycetota bacterium]